MGADKTLGRLRERFYWPGHYTHVREWCRDCTVCASRKSPTPNRRAPLQLFFRFSPPEQLHSDQGRNFEAAVITEVCRLLGVDKSRTTPYHPQSDGLVERFNRTLLSMLATAVTDRPFEWEQHLRLLCFAYNTSVHPTTGYSPFALMFGRKAQVPMDIVLGTIPPAAQTIPQYVAKLHTSLEAVYGYVRYQMGHQLQRHKSHYDGRFHGKLYEVGNMVWLHSPAVQRGRSRKLHRSWTGPYKVVTKLSDVVYRLQHVQARRKKPVVHFNCLKPCSPSVRLSPLKTQPERVVRPGPPAGASPAGGGVELLEEDLELEEAMSTTVPPIPTQHRHAPGEQPPGLTLADEMSQ